MRRFGSRDAEATEATGWVDSLVEGPGQTGGAGSVARFDPSVRTAAELAGAGPAWPTAAAIDTPVPAAAHSTAA